MQLHFHANILFLIHVYSSFYAIIFSCKHIIRNMVVFMQLFSCRYIDPDLVVFMQLHFHANILIVPNIVVFMQFFFLLF